MIPQDDHRAQVASLGSLLLVTVVVISAGTFGVYYVASVTGGTAGGAAGGADSVSLAIEATQDELQLSHNGGESVSGSSFRVTVENASGEITYAFDDGVVRGGDGDNRLDAGEAWRLTWMQSPGTDVTVTVVDTGTDPDRLLLRDTATVEQAATARPGNIVQGEDPTPTPAATSTPTPAPGPTSTPTPSPTATSTPTATATPVPSNDPPVADFTADRKGKGNSKNVDLDAASSSDSDGSIEKYEWDIGADGSVEHNGETVTNAKVPKGTDVKLTVTDDDGATDIIIKAVN
jgi:hypothetical protein